MEIIEYIDKADAIEREAAAKIDAALGEAIASLDEVLEMIRIKNENADV
jgi:hypothetical protein